MWNDHNSETPAPGTGESDTPSDWPQASVTPDSSQSGPTTQQPVSPQPARASFSAIGAPKVENITPATGAFPSRPVAEVNAAPAAPAAPQSLGTALPPSVGQPGQASVFTTQRIAAVQPVRSPEVATGQQRSGKRRTGLLTLLALLTVLASGAVSYAVSTAVADDVASSNPQPLPTAASAPAPATEPATTSATSAVDAGSLADEPFAVAAEIIRPSVVQLNLGTGLGTGVIINENGTILTAAHVLGDANDVTVTFFDGSSAQGTVVGTHVPTDVGVVQIDPEGRDLVVARLAQGEDVRVGQIAVAVGSPFGFDQTVTAGIISAVDRIVNNVSMVQTDASINPGNSGGPLINLDGEVVGINDLIFTESGSSAGVGFAISIDLAVIIADQIVQGVEPQLALFGVSTGAAPDGARGAQVGEVVPGSAAENAGVEVGDVIVALDGVNTRGSADLRAQVIDQAPGTDIVVTVIRDGQEVDLDVTLGQTG